MREQHSEILEDLIPASDPAEESPAESWEVAPAEKQYGFVAVCAGEGLNGVFLDLGCDGVISGGQTMNPSTEDILKVVEQTPAEVVYVLPNNKNIIMAAQQTVGLTEKNVVVIGTRTVPQGISAMLAFDSDQSVSEIEQSMTDAAANVCTMQVTYAARNSDFDGHAISEGEYIGLFDGALVGNGPDLTALLSNMAAKVNGCEFLTVFYGEDVQQPEAEKAAEVFRAACPEAELTLISGGQPVYYYLISAE